jgi:hypothetical protein
MTSLQHLRIGFLGLAALLAAALAWNQYRRNAPPPRPAPQRTVAVAPAPAPSASAVKAERALIEGRLAETKDYLGFNSKFAAAWPAEWSNLVETLAQARIAGGQLEGPDAWLAAALRELRRSRGVLAAKASPQALQRVFETQAGTLAALSAIDKRQCVDFLLGVPNHAFLEFSARNRPLIAQMAEAALDAILDGQTSKIARTAPRDEDFDLLERALVAKGLGKPEIDALLDGRYPDPPLPDDVLCAAGMNYLDVLKTLPEEARLRLYAFAVELMAKM